MQPPPQPVEPLEDLLGADFTSAPPSPPAAAPLMTPSGAPLLSEHEYSEMLRESARAYRTAHPVAATPRGEHQGKKRRARRAAERQRRRARAAQR